MSDGAPTHPGSPAAPQCPPPSRPSPTHSFSRARSPKKEPFSSTVILLLPSSLWEEQRERGSAVTSPATAPQQRPGAGRNEDRQTPTALAVPLWSWLCHCGGGHGGVPCMARWDQGM